MLDALAALDVSNSTTRKRLALVLRLTADPSKSYTTKAAFGVCGHSGLPTHEPLKACFYEVRKPHHWYQLPRLYKFDRFARALIQALLERYEQETAIPK